MIRKALLLGALPLCIFATPSYAVLSGYYDSAAKITAIFDDMAVGDALRQMPIGQISNTGTRADGADEWQVRTQECDLTVYVIGTPPSGPGATTYKVEIGENSCD